MKGWPRIGMPGELLWVAYAPVGALGNDDDDDDSLRGWPRIGMPGELL